MPWRGRALEPIRNTFSFSAGPYWGIVGAVPRPMLPLVLVTLAAGCGEDQSPERARELWDRIQDAGYRDWARAPGYEERVRSRAAHGDSVVIYVNDIVVEDLATSPPPSEWSEGSIIVKDGFDGGDLSLVAVMEKRGGEWFWAEYDDEGDTLFSGAPDLCTGCHAIGDDFVRGFFLPVE